MNLPLNNRTIDKSQIAVINRGAVIDRGTVIENNRSTGSQIRRVYI